MIDRASAERLACDLFLPVLEEFRALDDGQRLVRDGLAPERNHWLVLQGAFLLLGCRQRNRHRENMPLAVFVGHSIHIHALNQLLLVHEPFERVGPAFADSLQVLDFLHILELHIRQVSVLGHLRVGWLFDQTARDAGRRSKVSKGARLNIPSLRNSHRRGENVPATPASELHHRLSRG